MIRRLTPTLSIFVFAAFIFTLTACQRSLPDASVTSPVPEGEIASNMDCPEMSGPGVYSLWTVTAMAEPGEMVRLEPYFTPAAGARQRLSPDCLSDFRIMPGTAGAFVPGYEGRVVLKMADGLAEGVMVSVYTTYNRGHAVTGTIRIDYGE